MDIFACLFILAIAKILSIPAIEVNVIFRSVDEVYPLVDPDDVGYPIGEEDTPLSFIA